mmetsp:Transcript_24667/g.76196  ORF Transcript_24667/g.76196 Transcript_24667/m.76196 type:complete len:89 (-) Transcript_24667:560-826(-)
MTPNILKGHDPDADSFERRLTHRHSHLQPNPKHLCRRDLPHPSILFSNTQSTTSRLPSCQSLCSYVQTTKAANRTRPALFFLRQDDLV